MVQSEFGGQRNDNHKKLFMNQLELDILLPGWVEKERQAKVGRL